MTIHNVIAFHEDEGEDRALVIFSRPQDWGNPLLWQHIPAYIRVEAEDPRFKSRAVHIWCRPHHEPFEFLRSIGGYAFSFYFPGKPSELCDRSHLAQDDFWNEKWGEMPPHYDPVDFNPFDLTEAEISLSEALNDPANIPVALTPEMAVVVASLMQFALRHPRVQTELTALKELGRPFVEALMEKVCSKAGANADRLREIFEQGWSEIEDVTESEFDRDYRDIFDRLIFDR
jgi:hypothetical protein